MDVLADGRTLGERLDDGGAKVLGMRAREADPRDAGDAVARTEELAEVGVERGREIASPRVDVLAEESDLLDASSRQRAHLGDDLTGPAALLPSPDGRDDAVRALRIAPHRDLHPRLMASLAVSRQLGGEVLVRAELASGDRVTADRDPLAEMRDRSRPEGDVDKGVLLEDPITLRLGVTAADRDHEIGSLALARGRVPEIGGQPGVRLLTHRAGVEHDHVRVVRAHRFAEPERLEHALDPLRVVSVHLATEGRDVIPAHGLGM